MKKFVFKLEAVLKERKRLEDLKLKEWSLAQRILNEFIHQRDQLEKRLAEVIEGSSEAVKDTDGSVGMLHSIESFIHGSKIRISWKQQEVDRAIKLTEKKRVEYVAVRQKREVLEKLKEKKAAAFKAELRKKEIKEQGDLYIMSGNANKRISEEEGAA